MTIRNRHLVDLGLSRNPFPYTPDAGCYFTTASLDEHMVEFAHCVQARKGFSLLTAEVGMGKSTLVRRLITDLAKKDVVSALVFNTFLQDAELLAAVLQDFGLPSTGVLSQDIAELNIFLLRNHREGKTCLLVIDDAQNLSNSSLELIRLLCNLETDQEKLLQILLAGQPELEATLSHHSLRQLRSRVVKHARLHELADEEVSDYVKFRLDSSGSDGSIVMTPDASRMLWKESNGVPRRLHLIMDRCMYGLSATGRRILDAPLMAQAIAESRVEMQTPLAGSDRVITARPNSRRRTAYVLAGMLVSIVLGGAAWSQLANHSTTEHEVVMPNMADDSPVPIPLKTSEFRTSTPASLAAAASQSTTLNAAEPSAASCSATQSVGSNQVLVSQRLPELTNHLLGDRLELLKDACREHRDSGFWLTWASPMTGYDLNQRITAQRFQQGLVKYGGLSTQEIDGLWGERSKAALQRFQAGLGLPATGNADALTGMLLESFYVPG